MKFSAILEEITLRAGEGFEDWSERAKKAFKKAAIEIMGYGSMSMSDYPIFMRQVTYTAVSEIVLAYNLFMDSVETMVRIHNAVIQRYNTQTAVLGSAVTLNFISYTEYEAYLLNPNLLGTGTEYAYIMDISVAGTRPSLPYSNITLNANDVFTINYLAYNEDIFEGLIDEEAGEALSAIFIETAIARSVEILKAEIPA